MKYREDMYGNKLSILGFGCGKLCDDKPETERIVLSAIDNGINYFDTGYIYSNSEKSLGNILAKAKKRNDVYVATKMPLFLCKSANDFDKYFDRQLKRLQTDHIDYYLMHSVFSFEQWQKFQKIGIEDWIFRKKEAGLIGQIGFSFHGTCDDFLKVLDAYDWEHCLIQLNYLSENHQAGKTGLLTAEKKGLPVMIMSPLLGGNLASGLPKQGAEIFAAADPSLTPVDWALRWLWNLSGVTVVLSSMTTSEQTEQNLLSVDKFRPLGDEEFAVYDDVVKLFMESYKIYCTGCNYCMPCPKGVNISGCFSAYNASYIQGFFSGLLAYVMNTTAGTKSKRLCNECGKCEKICPQFIPIRETLNKVVRRFEPFPLRLLFALVRRIVTRQA